VGEDFPSRKNGRRSKSLVLGETISSHQLDPEGGSSGASTGGGGSALCVPVLHCKGKPSTRKGQLVKQEKKNAFPGIKSKFRNEEGVL